MDIYRDGRVTLSYSSNPEEDYRKYEIVYVSDKITGATSYYDDGSQCLYNYYNSDGTLDFSEFIDFDTGFSSYYLHDSGWSSDADELVPVDAPELLKDCSKGQIMAFAPAYGLCDHEWADATCLVLKTCVKCGLCEGELANHDYADADCDTPKTCSVCEETEGEALGHSFSEGKCTVCEADDPDYVPEVTKEPSFFERLIQMIIDFILKLFGIEKT